MKTYTLKLTIQQLLLLNSIINDIIDFYSFDKNYKKYMDSDQNWILSFDKGEFQSLKALKKKL